MHTQPVQADLAGAVGGDAAHLARQRIAHAAEAGGDVDDSRDRGGVQ